MSAAGREQLIDDCTRRVNGLKRAATQREAIAATVCAAVKAAVSERDAIIARLRTEYDRDCWFDCENGKQRCKECGSYRSLPHAGDCSRGRLLAETPSP